MPGHRQGVSERGSLFDDNRFLHAIGAGGHALSEKAPLSCPHSLVSVRLRSFKQLIGGLGDANNKQCDSDEVKAK